MFLFRCFYVSFFLFSFCMLYLFYLFKFIRSTTVTNYDADTIKEGKIKFSTFRQLFRITKIIFSFVLAFNCNTCGSVKPLAQAFAFCLSAEILKFNLFFPFSKYKIKGEKSNYFQPIVSCCYIMLLFHCLTVLTALKSNFTHFPNLVTFLV